MIFIICHILMSILIAKILYHIYEYKMESLPEDEVFVAAILVGILWPILLFLAILGCLAAAIYYPIEAFITWNPLKKKEIVKITGKDGRVIVNEITKTK